MANYTSTHTGATIDASVTIVSGSGVTQSDLTKLNAVTSSAIELNILDGVTASTAEINILDGLTASTAELNYLDGADSSITTLSLPDNTTITTFGASLIDDADAATARTTLGVDVAGTDNSTDVTLVTTSHDYLSISGQAITLGSIDISDDTNLTGGTGITLTGDTLSTTDSEIVHDNLSGFVANEHIDHSTVSISAGSGLSGGGDLTSTRTLSIDSSVVTLSATQTLSNKSISGTANTISNVHIVDDTINTLTIARGGTGGTTSAEARSNLNVDVAGTDNSTDVTLVTTSHDYLSLSGQEITLGEIDISDDTNLVGGTGITLTGDTLSTTDSEIVHDDLSGFVSNEHIDHSTVSITAGTGLSGGGDITTSRTLTTDDSAIVHDNLSGFVANEHIDHSGVSITAGAGLTGGGDITATRDIAVGAGTGVTVNANDVAIGQDVGTNADVTFNSVTSDDFIGSLNGAVQFEAKATVALNKGDAVYVVGISGNTPTIALADANDATKMPSFGLAASSASIDDVIEVVTFGTLRNINTSSFSEGDILFVSSNGTAGNTLTATKEGGESVLCQNIGKVIRSHATVGSIKVGGAGRANATPNLNDGNIFIGNGSNQAVSASLNTKIEDYLDGGTSTANFDTISVDGAEITATPAELNVLDGITSTTAELNYTDGVTSNIQTQLDLKAPLASPAFTGTATGANLTLSGDLTVNGSTTTLDTTNLAVEDNLMELNAGVTSNANDSGFLIERGSTGDNAIFMWDESADKFTLGTTTATGTTTGDITLSSTGTLVANVEGDVTGAVTGNADTATTLATARNFSLTGDVTAGAVSFDGSGNVALSTTIAANSVALGTDTTGNYMSDLTEGTGIDISHTPGEGSNGTITLDLTEVGFGGGANRLITDDGDGTVSTEDNLTFDGSTLALTGDFNVGSGDFFVDDSAGRVGIGTQSPAGNLHIQRSGTGSGLGDIISETTTQNGNAGYRFRTDGTDRWSIRTVGTNGADLSFRDADASAERLYINSSGNVGIGATTVDDGNLQIGDANSAFNIAIAGPRTKFGYDGSNAIVQGGTSKGIAFCVNNTTLGSGEAMRINSSGNVGIGDTNPPNKLSVKGSSTDLLYLEGDGITSTSIIASDTGGSVRTRSAGGAWQLYTGGSANSSGAAFATFAIEVDENQKVGIGTGSPTYELDVEGDIGMNAVLYHNGDDNTYLKFDTDRVRMAAGGETLLDLYEDGTQDYVKLGDGGDVDINLNDDMFVEGSSGNVGIGTQSPAGNLDVVPDTDGYSRIGRARVGYVGFADYAGFSHIDRANVSQYAMIQQSDGATFINSASGTPIYFRESNATKMILTGGNVGIGTTDPSSLDATGNRLVIGGGSGDEGLTIFSGTTGRGTMLFADGNDGSNAEYRGWIQYEHTNDSLEFATASAERMRINSSGNVGIGTASPNASLHINTTDDGSLYFTRDGGNAWSIEHDTGQLYFYNRTISKSVIEFEHSGAVVINENAHSTIDFRVEGDTDPYLLFTDASTDRVGIGTGSPAEKLHIVGNLRVHDGGYLAAGDSNDIFIKHDGSGTLQSNTGEMYINNVANTNLFFQTNNTERLRIDNQGNLRFADNGTNPTAVANTAFMFNDGGELKVLDELGNTTTISPHNFSLIPGGASEERAWGYYSEKDIVDDEGNVTATQKVNVDMMKLARLVEELTGEKLVYTEED